MEIIKNLMKRTRCQATAKPTSRRKNTRVSSDREADVAKEVQVECEAYSRECEADVRMDTKPMSR